MGRIVSVETRHNLVSRIESMIHHPSQLDSVVAEAKRSVSETGHLPNDMLWNYLTWRRDLDPSRFDHYHPEFLGVFTQEQHALERELQNQIHNLANSSMPISSIPIPSISISTSVVKNDVPTIGSPSGPSNVSSDLEPFTGNVPEPSSIVLLAVALIVGKLWFSLKRPVPRATEVMSQPCP